MGAIADIVNDEKLFSDGMDSVVIRHYNSGITGGRTLDMTGFPENVIRAGHIVVYDPATDTYKPLAVADGAYGVLPEGHEYAGVVVASKPKDKPFVGIMNDGEVNDLASPYPVTAAIKAAMKTAIPKLSFAHD